MKSINVLLIAVFILSGLRLKAQEDDRRLEDRKYMIRTDSSTRSNPITRGKIEVFQDDRIARLDSLKKEYPGKPSGFRVQIFFGNRKEALERKADFIESHPDIPAYISYLAPNFRLRVGDFRTRLEAERLKDTLDYTGCYIVRDKIELPDLPTD
jgi:hypothetical protein